MRALGARLATALEPGAVVLLRGPLGAGKTTLAQGIARQLGVAGRVSSPSFVLVRDYPLPDGRRLLHLDFYRLANADEVVDLGVADDLGAPDTIVLIEWPEHGGTAVPEDSVAIDIAIEGERRLLTIRGQGPQSERVVRRLADQQLPAVLCPRDPAAQQDSA